jgi:uncharacterized protein YkwD
LRPDPGFTRRSAIAGGLALAAAPALAAGVDRVRDAAPPASDVAAWTAYEARLRARLDDAGGGRFDDDAAHAVLELTNRARGAAGAPAVNWHDELAAAARAHAADLAQRRYVEHLSPEGFDPGHRLWLIGRTTIGSPSENIAYHAGDGPPATPQRLFELWRRSPPHWENLRRSTHTDVGYGLARTRGHAWLVGLYAKPLAALAEPLPFRARGPQVGRALAALPGELRPRVAVPQGSRLGEVVGSPPVMQITAIRRLDASGYAIIGGPIFLAAT